jgi:hypothetical protein
MSIFFFSLGSITVTHAKTDWPEFQPRLSAGQSNSPVKAPPIKTAISSPADTTDVAKAAYLGKWDGWMCRRRRVDVKVAVSEINDNEAMVAYHVASEQIAPTTQSFTGKFLDGEIVGILPHGRSEITLAMRDDGNLNIRWRNLDREGWCTGIISRSD